MLRKDFIMVQIEELAKVVLQIVTNRNTNAARHNPELIQTVYTSLKLDHQTLMTEQPDTLVQRLNRDDNGGFLRLEIGVKTLIEESYLYPDKETPILQRALILLNYLQTHDNTFSLERVRMLEELKERIIPKKMSPVKKQKNVSLWELLGDK